VAPAITEKAGTPSETEAPAQPVPTDKWQFQVTPYFWLESLHGTAGVGNRTAGVEMDFGDVFGDLNFFIMGTFEARKGRFFSLTDVEYASISDDKATPGPFFSSVDAGFKQFIFDQEVGYRLYSDPDNGASIDVLGGARVWRVKTDFEFGAGILPAVRIEGSRSWVDAVGGLRGRAPISEKMFLTGKFDLGGGGSKFTWQLFGGAGYSIKENIALIFGYRVLDVDYNRNNFVYNLNQRGPIVGLGFRF
jgi:opacity protein-like surface antigen